MNIRYIVFSIACLFVLSACHVDQPTGKQMSSFTFIDQDEQPFGTDDLRGKVWVASFIFAGCETVCPPMMFEMSALQDAFEQENIQVEFVSFTVDPASDTSEVLKEYIQQFTDEEANWHMLTGYSQEKIEEFARTEFQTIVQKPKTSTQVIHGTNFYLIDDQGYVIDEYSYIDESYVEEMIGDIRNIP